MGIEDDNGVPTEFRRVFRFFEKKRAVRDLREGKAPLTDNKAFKNLKRTFSNAYPLFLDINYSDITKYMEQDIKR
ncbi:hypothetical protein [Paenibacillus sophorae]|uniref:Uncharacterized protein n=1 Tax=Paenibacillus sophorae TaxID=1333845 RepID=A0ABX8H539_9BACL|nr:hypothetical protein [Paenibacillus sophorae]QWU13224.1 hypothetical protein KP014_14475 [Paenibacillus sophorae]